MTCHHSQCSTLEKLLTFLLGSCSICIGICLPGGMLWRRFSCISDWLTEEFKCLSQSWPWQHEGMVHLEEYFKLYVLRSKQDEMLRWQQIWFFCDFTLRETNRNLLLWMIPDSSQEFKNSLLCLLVILCKKKKASPWQSPSLSLRDYSHFAWFYVCLTWPGNNK